MGCYLGLLIEEREKGGKYVGQAEDSAQFVVERVNCAALEDR